LHHNAISEALTDIQTKRSFACSGCLFPVELLDPRLSVKEVGFIELPLSENEKTTLVEVSKLAPFGARTETIINTEVRNTWEIETQDVYFGGTWHACLEEAMMRVKNELDLHPGVE
jgi:hypothetical protein